ncbi:beta-phosphoglucomutase family hydrolase [Ornithinimicrobium sp. Arc0846-15]|nr:beta-phosphoglucomutase family hydrolase [Ornithinimicrobium laminariae]
MDSASLGHFSWTNYDAALFDLDGVLTPTAEVHMRAWEKMFNDYLGELEGQTPYTEQDYFDYVDGKPRYEGVQSFLDSRSIDLPFGEPEDESEAVTVCGLGNRKNELFTQVLRDGGIEAYPGSLQLLDHLKSIGVQMAVVSSSKNAPDVLAVAGIADRFPIVVHGGVAAEKNIPGKPRPDTYTFAAQELGLDSRRCVVFEDAISGVQAGAAGDFGLVVGVDRGAGVESLTTNGAGIVVADLNELI